MSDEEFEHQPSLLDAIYIAENLLKDLKKKVIDAGDNEALAASSILLKDGDGEQLTNTLNWLRNRAEGNATEIWGDICLFLENHSTLPEATFWDHFHVKIKDLGKADIDYRRKCLFRDVSLFHEVCKLNPTAEVIQTLIDVTPPAWKNEDKELNPLLFPYKHGQEYNHLARDSGVGNGCEYPLHKVMRHGGSIELVKVLVSADADIRGSGTDKDGGALNVSHSRDSIFHVLTANKARHPEDFSDILRYLVLSMDLNATHWSPLLQMRSDNKTPVALLKNPVALLWQSMKDEGLSDADVLQNDDFTFLLKATCYHHSHYCSSEDLEGIKEYNGKRRVIEQIPFAHAFLVCCGCFDKELITKVLEDLFSLDSTFLLEKDRNGKYPIHGIVSDHSYIMSGHGRNFKLFIIKTILRIAPHCAQQTDDKGLLPLHIVADIQREDVRDSCRLSFVSTIWKAYPEAAGAMDSETGLPPFALSVRGGSERDAWFKDRYSGLSSAYFLLRQRPEILSEVIKSSINFNAKATTEPPAKRPCTSAP